MWILSHITRLFRGQKMKAGPDAYRLIMKHEGCHRILPNGKVEAYLCPSGVWTIGYGHTRTAKQGLVITQSRAIALLNIDVGNAEDDLRKLLKVPVEQHHYDALISWVYNFGYVHAVESTLMRLLNQGNYAGAAAEFKKWNKERKPGGKVVTLPGLIARRADEVKLFTSGDRQDHAPLA